METTTVLYWITRLDGIISFLIGLGILGGVIILSIIIASLVSSDFDEFHNDNEISRRKNTRKRWRNKIKWILPLTITFFLIAVFIPSKKDAIFIIAGGKTIDWAKADTNLAKIPSQTTLIISKYFDKQVKELEKEQQNYGIKAK